MSAQEDGRNIQDNYIDDSFSEDDSELEQDSFSDGLDDSADIVDNQDWEGAGGGE